MNGFISYGIVAFLWIAYWMYDDLKNGGLYAVYKRWWCSGIASILFQLYSLGGIAALIYGIHLLNR